MEFKFNNIEEVLEFARVFNRASVVAPGQVTPAGIDTDGLVKELARVARNGSKITVIKIVRAVTGLSLKDSKEAVERAPEFAKHHAPVAGKRYICSDPNCGCVPNLDDTAY